MYLGIVCSLLLSETHSTVSIKFATNKFRCNADRWVLDTVGEVGIKGMLELDIGYCAKSFWSFQAGIVLIYYFGATSLKL